MSVKDSVTELVEPILASLGYDLVEVSYKKQHDAMHLTVFIDTDKPGGVSLDDTEIVMNAIDGPIDELDPTAGAPFVLNVSSPGLDRPLKTEKDYLRKMGTEIEVSLYAPVAGAKKHIGVLSKYNAGVIALETANGEIEIAIKDIAVAKPFISF